MSFLPYLFFSVLQSHAAESSAEHKHAIVIAREGNPAKGLQIIEKLADQDGWHDSLLYDYIVLLTWAKRDLEAYNLFLSKVNQDTAPAYVIEAIAKACRNLKLFSKAQQFYRLLQQKEPHNPDVAVGLASIQIDMDKPYEAILILSEAEKTFSGHLDLYLIFGKAYYSVGLYVDALRYYNKALTINSQHHDAVQGQALCLSHIKSPFEALEKTQKHPKDFSKEQIKDMEAVRGATLINWGKIDRDNIETYKGRYVYLDRAIADIKQQMENTSDENRKHNLQLDLIVAYAFRLRHRDVVYEYEQMLAKGKTNKDFPIYVLEGIADAFLTLRHPEKARELFKYILENDFKNPKAIEGYFFSTLECNKPEVAFAFIKANRDAFKEWIPLADSRYPNNSRLLTEELYYNSFSLVNLLSQADEKTKEAMQIMPLNSSMRNLRGNVLQARGLPRASEKEYDIGLTNDPKNIELQLSKARVHLNLNEPEKAEEIMKKIEKDYPESLNLKRFKREWKSYHAPEFVSDNVFETGGSGNTGKYSFTSDNRLYSQTFANHYRVFGSAFYQWGTFLEGTLNRTLEGAGLEYRNRDIRLLGEINTSQWGRSRVGTSLEAAYQPHDSFKMTAQADINSRQTPGRAIMNNITSNYYNLGFDYYKNESFEAGLSVYDQTFSDNNNWVGSSAFVKGRVIEKPRHVLDLRLNLGARWSNTNNVPYYSPSQDKYVSLAPIFTQSLYERYDQSFSHIITPEVGNYWQKGYGNRLTFGLSYEHRWKCHNWYEIGYGIARRRNYYDGEKQYTTVLLLNINMKF